MPRRTYSCSGSCVPAGTYLACSFRLGVPCCRRQKRRCPSDRSPAGSCPPRRTTLVCGTIVTPGAHLSESARKGATPFSCLPTSWVTKLFTSHRGEQPASTPGIADRHAQRQLFPRRAVLQILRPLTAIRASIGVQPA